jgi:uncharacterized protein (TIGR02145 family)
MKKATILFLLLFITIVIKAQDYEISFTGSGESTSVDSVFVENLTQDTTIELAGSDILHLVGSAGVASQPGTNEDLQIYPNPMKGSSKLEFSSGQPDDVKIEIYDVGGKLIAGQSVKVQPGTNVFEISGFPAGTYTANIKTSAWQKSAGFISVNNEVNTPAIKSGSEIMIESQTKSLKSTKSLIQMQYNVGDTLLFKGVAGDHTRILTKVPTYTQTINFEFVACTDNQGNNYAVVTIGYQTWMAENLREMYSVDGPDSHSQAGPRLYVYGYDGTDAMEAQATANYDTYGVLYNWVAANSGICPDGWHLPTDAEWTTLTDYLGGEMVAAGKLKESGTMHWISSGSGTTNETAFTALPGGYRGDDGEFHSIGNLGYWWSATDIGYSAWRRYMVHHGSDVGRAESDMEFGFSVRCVMD